jgi:hypothetical protein
MKEQIEKIYEWLSIGGFQFNDQSKLPLAVSLIKEETEEMLKGIEENNRGEILDGFVDSWWVFCNALYFAGFKLEEVVEMFEKIEKSNYSKFPLTREEAVASAEAYIKGEHPNKMNQPIPAKYESTGNSQYPFVIKHAKTGKLLKSINYLDPDKF